MPLSILVPMILIGLPLVIGLVYFINRSQKPAPVTDEIARTLFSLDNPNVDIDRVILDDKGMTALVTSDDRLVGLVTKFGQNHITRHISGGFIRRFESADLNIDVWTNDFTLKHFRLRVSDNITRDALLQHLETAKKDDGFNHT